MTYDGVFGETAGAGDRTIVRVWSEPMTARRRSTLRPTAAAAPRHADGACAPRIVEPGQERLADLRVVAVDLRPETERRPVADIGVGIA